MFGLESAGRLVEQGNWTWKNGRTNSRVQDVELVFVKKTGINNLFKKKTRQGNSAKANSGAKVVNQVHKLVNLIS